MSTNEHDDTRALTTVRLLDAPRERVFRAWTEPERLARWWGPNGFTNTIQAIDVRSGGVWRFVMHGPDGANYENESVFEVVAPERIVLRHVGAPRFQLTATFSEEQGKTRVTWRQLFETVADCDRLRAMCVPANEQNLDRLEAELAAMS